MTHTYTLTIHLESYEYDGAFYLIGEGYETPGGVLEHVAADHILRIADTTAIEGYLLEVLAEGETVGKATYEACDPEIECEVHIDVYHQLYSFWTGEYVIEIDGVPTQNELTKIAEELK